MRKNNSNTIEIQEEVRIPGTDYVLEKGDRVRVQEDTMDDFLDSIEKVIHTYADGKVLLGNGEYYFKVDGENLRLDVTQL